MKKFLHFDIQERLYSFKIMMKNTIITDIINALQLGGILKCYTHLIVMIMLVVF
jgi:hypothetical protein